MRRTFLMLPWLIPTLAWAAPVVPDRPGFSTGTATVPPGALQVEMGVRFSYSPRSADLDSYTAPLLNLRTGLTEKTEFNLLWDGMQVVKGEGHDTADLMVGVKHRLHEGNQFNFSLLGYLFVQEGRLAPFLGLLWDRKLSSFVGLFGTLQVSTSAEASEWQTNFQPAVGLAFSHGPQLGSFVEIYSDVPLESSRLTSTVIDTGVAWLPREDVQLDINFGLALDNRSEDFVGIGLAVRY